MTMPADTGHRFRLIAFDWDGTAVANRHEDASRLRAHLERLLRCGVVVAVITGTKLANVDHQLSQFIRGPHKRRLFVATNRGSEVYGFDDLGAPALLYERRATNEEDGALDAIAADVRADLVRRTGLVVDVVSDRMNRRKIDLIPEWHDPPKSSFGELLAAVESRLRDAGLDLKSALAIAARAARHHNLSQARITSDLKHIEIGLTDKADSMRWIMRELARAMDPRDVLVAGDEMGPVAGLAGSDSLLMIDEARGATFVSVGVEPAGVPPGVEHLPGGPARFNELLAAQGALWPLEPLVEVKIDSSDIVETGFTPEREHEVESLLAIGNGRVGARASLATATRLSRPATFLAGLYDAQSAVIPELVVLPDWSRFVVHVDGRALDGVGPELRRVLDVDLGAFITERRLRDDVGRVVRFTEARLASRADPSLLLQTILIAAENFSGALTIEGPFGIVADGETSGGAGWSLATMTEMESRDRFLRIVGEQFTLEASFGAVYRFDRVACVSSRAASAHLGRVSGQKTVAELVAEHRGALRRRLAAASVTIDGDDAAQRALSFARHHLIAAADPMNEHASIGARGLTGGTYKGHVFWDTEIFMLPFFTHTWPRRRARC